MDDSLEITLNTLVYGGEAMGRLPDGRTAFVPCALPGERARIRLVEKKRGYVRAKLVEVLMPSAERIPPRCRHFGACGGCHYQHMTHPAQLNAKTEILIDQLARIGHIQNPPVNPAIPSPQEWRYRNHVQFHLTRDGKLGYVGAGTGPTPAVIPISECHLPEEPLNVLWPGLEFGPGLGLERLSLRLGSGGEIMLVLESSDPKPPELEIEADISVVHLFEGDAVVMAGDKYIFMDINPGRELPRRTFRVSAASFFQVNTLMAAKMVEHLLDRLPLKPQSTLLDVYCGVGLFSAFLAAHVGRLIGIESSPSACEDFAANLDEFDNVELYEAPAEDVLPALTIKADIAILDPPRAGLQRRALEGILALRPRRLAYVSCDPATLARDASRLVAEGYCLTEVTPFDLFPQTYHIESISLFETA